MQICVVGTGYVGLVAGACFAEMGNDVVCVDVDASKIEMLNRGVLPIYEPGLDTIVERNVRAKRLEFSTAIEESIARCPLVFVAVGTPQSETGTADLTALWSVIDVLATHAADHTIVVIKSTVPVGTHDSIRHRLCSQSGRDIAVCSNPEFLKEGLAVADFLRPDRVIVGSRDAWAVQVLRHLYEPFLRVSGSFLEMDPCSAEMTKYAANAMLATRISFMNELANLCDRVGADIDKVRVGIGSDGRIGPKFLFAGAGYGGSCFPKDLRALLATGREQMRELALVQAVERVNECQKGVLGDKVMRAIGHPQTRSLAGRRICVWGLAFKPGTDDVREAPALVLVDQLLAHGAEIVAHDPVATRAFDRAIGPRPSLHYVDNPYEAVRGCHALVLVTEWSEYRRPNFDRLLDLMVEHYLFDGRNIWDSVAVRRLGFHYAGIGRP